MKKLSALIAMVLCLTIGGVYAAWTYQGTTTSFDEKHADYNIQLETTATDSSYGSIEIESNISVIVIDQLGDEAVNDTDYHKARLVYKTIDSQPAYIKITVDLLPSVEKDEILNVLAKIQYEITIEGVAGQYDGDDIFEDKKVGADAKTTISDIATWTEVDEAARIYSFTIDESRLASEFGIYDFWLETLDEYNAFGAALYNGSVDPVVKVNVTAE